MSDAFREQLLLVLIGGVIGILATLAGSILAYSYARRSEKDRRKSDAITALLDAASQFTQRPDDGALGFLLARAGFLAWPYLSLAAREPVLAFHMAAGNVQQSIPRDQHGNVVPEWNRPNADQARVLSDRLTQLRDALTKDMEKN